MGALNSLIAAIEPLKIYSVTQGSNLYNELSAYACELDRLNSDLDLLLRECFITTAQSYGLSMTESVYTRPYEELTPQERRLAILNRLRTGDDDFTVSSIREAVESLGAEEYSIIEYPGKMKIVVQVSGDYTDGRADYLKNEIPKLLPAHLEAYIYFFGLTWQQFESRNFAFAALDAMNKSWESIDEQKNT